LATYLSDRQVNGAAPFGPRVPSRSMVRVPELDREMTVLDGVLWPTHGSTKMFLQFIQAHAERFRGKRGLDLGAGSGALGIAMARAGADVTAVDIVPLAVENTAANLAEETPEVHGRVRVGQSDLYERLPEITGEAQPVFDVIVANHPVNDGEPTAAAPLSYVTRAGADYRIVRGILAGLPARLAAGGVAYVHAGLRGSVHVWNEEQLREEAARHGLRVELVARGTVEADDGPYAQGVFEVRRDEPPDPIGAGSVIDAPAAIHRAPPPETDGSPEKPLAVEGEAGEVVRDGRIIRRKL
jgi:methylase of polypeptide subunit release factors